MSFRSLDSAQFVLVRLIVKLGACKRTPPSVLDSLDASVWSATSSVKIDRL